MVPGPGARDREDAARIRTKHSKKGNPPPCPGQKVAAAIRGVEEAKAATTPSHWTTLARGIAQHSEARARDWPL